MQWKKTETLHNVSVDINPDSVRRTRFDWRCTALRSEIERTNRLNSRSQMVARSRIFHEYSNEWIGNCEILWMKKLDRFICSIWYEYLQVLINCLIFRKCSFYVKSGTSFLCDCDFYCSTFLERDQSGTMSAWRLHNKRHCSRRNMQQRCLCYISDISIRKWLFARHFNQFISFEIHWARFIRMHRDKMEWNSTWNNDYNLVCRQNVDDRKKRSVI